MTFNQPFYKDTDRKHLQAVAYRMLGSFSEAEDAVQETWLRLSRTDVGEVNNLTGLTGKRCRADLSGHASFC